MGQTLSEPITAKESASMQNDKVKVGSSSMQGWRISMEDAHTHILELKEDPASMFFAGEFSNADGFPVLRAHLWRNVTLAY